MIKQKPEKLIESISLISTGYALITRDDVSNVIERKLDEPMVSFDVVIYRNNTLTIINKCTKWIGFIDGMIHIKNDQNIEYTIHNDEETITALKIGCKIKYNDIINDDGVFSYDKDFITFAFHERNGPIYHDMEYILNHETRMPMTVHFSRNYMAIPNRNLRVGNIILLYSIKNHIKPNIYHIISINESSIEVKRLSNSSNISNIYYDGIGLCHLPNKKICDLRYIIIDNTAQLIEILTDIAIKRNETEEK